MYTNLYFIHQNISSVSNNKRVDIDWMVVEFAQDSYE